MTNILKPNSILIVIAVSENFAPQCGVSTLCDLSLSAQSCCHEEPRQPESGPGPHLPFFGKTENDKRVSKTGSNISFIYVER